MIEQFHRRRRSPGERTDAGNDAWATD